MHVDRINVVAIGARDYYQVAKALKSTNRLGYLITDFYAGPLTRLFTSKRQDPNLPREFAISLWPCFILASLFNHSRFNIFRRNISDFAFGFLAAACTALTGNRAIVYSYYLNGFCAFYKLARKKPLTLICFQVHPTPWFINSLMEADTARFAKVADVVFISDIESSVRPSQIATYQANLELCDSIMGASSVSIRSALQATQSSLPSFVCPYGSKLQSEGARSDELHAHETQPRTIKLITVCQLLQRKGMHWAFYAMRSLPPKIQEVFEWTVICGNSDPAIFDEAPSNCHFSQKVSRTELQEALRAADLFVMPSIVEGFGLVYIESLSQGTPIIYTENTGANDICAAGVHGFRVNASSSTEIAKIFEDIAQSPAKVFAMRRECIELARSVTWDKFQAKVNEAVTESRNSLEMPSTK